MPASPKSRTIALRVELKERLEKKYKEEKEKRPYHISTEFGGYVNDLLSDFLDKDEFLAVYAPFLSVFGYNQNKITLNDASRNKKINNIDVIVEDGILKCLEDNKTDCVHCHFVWAIPEVARLNLKKPER